MLYDKNHFKKINDKKVLHKVKKHWVTIAMSTLMLLGGTGLASATTTHASQTGNNSSNQGHQGTLNNQGDNHSPQLVNGDQFANQSNHSNGSVSDHATENNHGQLNALNLSQAKPQTDNSTSDLLNGNRKQQLAGTDNGRTPKVQPSVTLSQIHDATQKAEKLHQRYEDAARVWNQLGSGHQHRTLGDDGDDATAGDTEEGENGKENGINYEAGEISGFANRLSGYESSMKSASNSAAAWLSRYTNIDSFSDSSAAASAADQQINSDIDKTSLESMTVDNVDASLANSEVSQYDTGDANNYSAIDSLYNKVNALYNSASNEINSASNNAQDAGNQFDSITSLLGSVSAAADEGDSSDSSTMSSIYNQSYPVADVYNGNQFYAAAWNKNIHQINLMTNINLWDMPTGYGGSVNYYQDIPGRSLNVNGLNDDGTWNTIDAIDYNFEMNTVSNADPGNTIREDIKNLRMYGSSYWGVFSINNDGDADSTDSYQKFDNVDYVGSQLTYNQNSHTNSIFAGKIRVNLGSYAPEGQDWNGNPITHYDYNSGGLSPVPYAGEKDDIENDPTARSNFHTVNFSGGYNNNGVVFPNSNNEPVIDHNAGVDCASDQEIIQADGVNVTFEPDCRFEGYTSNGDGLDARYGAHVELAPGSYVHITPRGTWGENIDSGGSYLPTGVYLKGYGTGDQTTSMVVDNGATLKVTPTDETDSYNNADIDKTQPGYNNRYFYPGAIYLNSPENTSIDVDIKPGGTIDVKYPTYPYRSSGQMLSIPSNSDVGTGAPNAAFDMAGDVTMEAEQNAKFIVDGGKPTDIANKKGLNDQAFLVAFNSDNTGNIKADTNSTVDLKVAGNQPIVLFNAPSNAQINVDDPKKFALNFMDNTSPETQLASTGVGIKGRHVNVLDENGKSYGQYQDAVFPGTLTDFVKGDQQHKDLMNQIDSIYQQIDKWINNNLPGNISTTVINAFDTQSNKNATYNKVMGILPYADTTLKDQNSQNMEYIFNHSFDLESTILHQMKTTLNSSLSQYHLSQLSDNDINQMLATLGDSGAAQDRPMQYAGETVYLRPGGYDLQKGFAFLGVPSTYVEGISVQGRTISGYAYPSSYIRFNKGSNTGAPVYTPGHTLDDHLSYNGHEPMDPGDNSPYHMDYVTTAGQDGYWSYTVPNGVDPYSLDVTAHTQTVAPYEAARLVKQYVTGRGNVSTHDTPNTANKYDSDSNHIPQEVYDDDATDLNTGAKIGHDDAKDDTNAGNDFQAGYIKGTYDKDNLATDPTVYSEPDPFIIGYELAQGQSLTMPLSKQMNYDQGLINGYVDYLPPVRSDSSTANSSSAAIGSTSADLNTANNAMKHFNSSYSSLNGTISDIATDSTSATWYTTSSSDSTNTGSEYNSVSNIDTSASSVKNSFSNDYTDFLSAEQSYESYYTAASLAAAQDDPIDKDTNIVEAHAFEDDMNTDVSAANSYANSMVNMDSSASSDNQVTSSDSSSVSASTFSAHTEASNSIASAFDSLASSYSSAIYQASSEASVNSDLISSKASYLSSEATVISSEYNQIGSYSGYFNSMYNQLSGLPASVKNNDLISSEMRELSDDAHRMNRNNAASNDSSNAKKNSRIASNQSGIASVSNANMPGYESAADSIYQSASADAAAESAYNSLTDFPSASSENHLISGEDNGINSSASVASSAVSSAWTTIKDLNDDDTDISAAISFANSMAVSLNSVIDIDSGIASGDRSAVASASSDNQSYINRDPSASSIVNSTSSAINSDNSAISSAIANHNLPSADSEAANAESNESIAESVITSAEGLEADRTVPVHFMDQNGSQAGCTNSAVGHVGESVTLPNAPSGYVYSNASDQSYSFVKDSIDNTKAGYMKPDDVKVIGDEETLPVQFVDEDGNPVTGDTKTMRNRIGDTVSLPFNDVPSGYTLVPGQDHQYTYSWSNVADPANNEMYPHDIYVYADRNFQFNVRAHELVNGHERSCVDTTSVTINGPDNKSETLDPSSYAPEGFTVDPSDHPVTVKITKEGLDTSHIDWKYDAETTNASNSKAPQPIHVNFINADDGTTVGQGIVNGYMNEKINVLSPSVKGHLNVPSGYQIVPGANTSDRINMHTQTLNIPVDPQMADNAVINYVDTDTGNTVTQRAIDYPVSTPMNSIGNQYTQNVPYDYQYGNHNSWQNDPNAKVSNNTEYTVDVIKDHNRPAPVHREVDTQVHKDDGEIDVQYYLNNATTPFITRKTYGSDNSSFTTINYINPDIQMPKNFSTQNITYTTDPTNYHKGSVQDFKIYISGFKKAAADATVNYQDVANGNTVGTAHIQGNSGDVIDYNQYQQFIPSGYSYAGMGNHADVLEPGDQETILVQKAQPTVSIGQITLNYVERDDHNNIVKTDNSTTLHGLAGTGFNLGYYEDNLPISINRDTFVSADKDPLSYTTNGQTINITVKAPQKTSNAYGNVHVYFVKADAHVQPTDFETALSDYNKGTDTNKLKKMLVPNSLPETMTGRVGDIFTPYAYEYNLPKDTTFNHVVSGQNIDSITADDQNLVIAVDTTNGQF